MANQPLYLILPLSNMPAKSEANMEDVSVFLVIPPLH